MIVKSCLTGNAIENGREIFTEYLNNLKEEEKKLNTYKEKLELSVLTDADNVDNIEITPVETVEIKKRK